MAHASSVAETSFAIAATILPDSRGKRQAVPVLFLSASQRDGAAILRAYVNLTQLADGRGGIVKIGHQGQHALEHGRQLLLILDGQYREHLLQAATPGYSGVNTTLPTAVLEAGT
jgi:hypothetical protein